MNHLGAPSFSAWYRVGVRSIRDVWMNEWMNRIKRILIFTNFLMIWLDDRARRSPRKLPTSLKKGERKWVPPKFLPHKYDVKLQNEDKVSWYFMLTL